MANDLQLFREMLDRSNTDHNVSYGISDVNLTARVCINIPCVGEDDMTVSFEFDSKDGHFIWIDAVKAEDDK